MENLIFIRGYESLIFSVKEKREIRRVFPAYYKKVGHKSNRNCADNIEGEDRFGTAPVRDAFFAMANSQLIGDLENVQGFIAKAQYPSPMHALRPEWGSISNLRFLLSSIGSQTTAASLNGATVFNVFCTGLEAYACIEQDGYSANFIYRPPIYDSPLSLNASVGYKFAEVPRITNDSWIINLRCTLSV